MSDKKYIERDAAYKACETYFSGVCVYDVSASEATNDFKRNLLISEHSPIRLLEIV